MRRFYFHIDLGVNDSSVKFSGIRREGAKLPEGAPMPDYPSSDESFARLRQAGWSVGEIRGCSGLWYVSGTNGENVIGAEGRCQAEAWYRAALQAKAAGMLWS
jgi:hypothetical protein